MKKVLEKIRNLFKAAEPVQVVPNEEPILIENQEEEKHFYILEDGFMAEVEDFWTEEEKKSYAEMCREWDRFEELKRAEDERANREAEEKWLIEQAKREHEEWEAEKRCYWAAVKRCEELEHKEHLTKEECAELFSLQAFCENYE